MKLMSVFLKILHSQERFAVNAEQRVSKKQLDSLRGSIPGELLLRPWSGAATGSPMWMVSPLLVLLGHLL